MNLGFLFRRVSETLTGIVGDYRRRQELRRAREEYLAERKAQIEQGKVPPAFSSYGEYLSSEWWQRIRSHTLNYLSNRCEFCGYRAAQVHHVRYPRFKLLGTESIKSIYAVCGNCHDVAHGQNVGNSDWMCAFCGSSATATLHVTIPKHDQQHQRVCGRCYSLGNGYRAQANGWPQNDYEAWVERWRTTMPPMNFGKVSTNIPNEKVRDVEEERRIVREKIRVAAAREKGLKERLDHLNMLTTSEIRVLWDRRDSLDYEPDELQLLRAVLRKRLGINRA